LQVYLKKFGDQATFESLTEVG